MKEFKEWFSNFDCATIDCHGIGCNVLCKEIREETWRAALEEILSQLKHPIYSADIIKWIEQELGDT